MTRAWFWVVLVLSLAAVAASALLLVDYVRPAPVFCDEEGGCGALRQTVFARPLGIPTPVFGLSGFLAIGLLALLRGRRVRIAQAALATFGGLVALFFFYVQWRLRTLCPYCAVVDGAGLLLMGLCIARAVRGWEPPEGRRVFFGAGAAFVLAIALPLVVGAVKPPIPVDVPAPIAEEMRRTPRGKVTIVDFIDFECPFCRLTHEELAPLLEEYGDKVRLVRRHVPLRMHPHATDAARAAVCGELLGKGDAFADALVAAKPEELTPEGADTIAQRLGLDVPRFHACMRDPATDARIRQDGEMFRASKGRGLPMLWIDGTRVVGMQDRASLRAAIETALASK